MPSHFREGDTSSDDRSGSTEELTDHRTDRQPSKQTGGTIRASHPIVEVGRLSETRSGYRGDGSVLESRHAIEREAEEIARAVTSHPIRQSVASTRGVRRSHTADFVDRDAVAPSVGDTVTDSTDDSSPASAGRSRPQRTVQRTSPASQYAGSIDRVTDGGKPLPSSVRTHFESRFGTTLDDVRIHTSAAAEQLAAVAGARAFTRGNHVVFGPDEYRPHTAAGRHLLAHELAHVLQWRFGVIEDRTIARMNADESDFSWVVDDFEFASGSELFLSVLLAANDLRHYGLTGKTLAAFYKNESTQKPQSERITSLRNQIQRLKQSVSNDQFQRFVAGLNESAKLGIVPEIYHRLPIHTKISLGPPHQQPKTEWIDALIDSGCGTKDSTFDILVPYTIAEEAGIEIPPDAEEMRIRGWTGIKRVRLLTRSVSIDGHQYQSMRIGIKIDETGREATISNAVIRDSMIGATSGIVLRYSNAHSFNTVSNSNVGAIGRPVRILPGENRVVPAKVSPRQESATGNPTDGSHPSHRRGRLVSMLVDTGAFTTALDVVKANEIGILNLNLQSDEWDQILIRLNLFEAIDRISVHETGADLLSSSNQTVREQIERAMELILSSNNWSQLQTILSRTRLELAYMMLTSDPNVTADYLWEEYLEEFESQYRQFVEDGGYIGDHGKAYFPATIDIAGQTHSLWVLVRDIASENKRFDGAIGQNLLDKFVVGKQGYGIEF